MMKEETKTGGTKRRAYTMVPYDTTSSISRRVNRLARKMKVNNPTHMYQLAGSTWSPSTTGKYILSYS